ncbi:hypothetical protein BBF96_04890 [Anoxybacter fermentans]|uniref:Chemotaxis protein n=1 Tax=Anoxybacter fermentans TaxID=1323375 RepID=A0A3S9SWZ3_9FIRM|nr:methyl-accepting chemotaxis protein [Anoxybacter fermentans]AZR72788.1 hypothetical protein BBF96_04890 [Anoxybacter fermentans]
MSLKNKFLIVVLLSLIIPITIISGFINFKMSRVLENNVNQINQYLLDKIYNQLKNELDDLNKTLRQVIEGNTIGFYLLGSMNIFQQKMDSLFTEFPMIRRVYIIPTGVGASLAQPYEYPELPKEFDQRPIWEEKWIDRPLEELMVWDGPYQSPDGHISLIFPGAAYSLGKKSFGLVFFEVSVEALKAKIAGDLESQKKELYFISKSGMDYLTGKNFSKEIFFSEMTTDETKSMSVTIDGRKYLAFFKPIPILDSYLLLLEEHKTAFASKREVSKFILFISICAFLTALVLITAFVQRMLIKPLEILRSAAFSVASGDLTVYTKLSGKDEMAQLADSFNQMTDSLKEVISLLINSSQEVRNVSRKLYSSFQEIAASNSQNNKIINDLAQIAENQSIKLTESSRLTSNIFGSIKEFAGKMGEVKDNSTRVLDNARKGQNGIHEAVQTITDLNENIQKIIYNMEDLKSKSREINEITDLITQFTEQTNLLALNASIEAARDGQSGMGFAVVAQEIRNLAEESRTATERISQIIQQVQTMVDQVGKEVEAQANEFNQSVNFVEIAGKTFGQIVDDILAVDKMLEEMNQHIASITEASEAIDHNISDVAAQAQESAASAEEIAASSEENEKMMERLNNLVTHLQELSIKLGKFKDRFKI